MGLGGQGLQSKAAVDWRGASGGTVWVVEKLSLQDVLWDGVYGLPTG